MTFPAFGEFVRYLESIGELRRVTVEVDPELEITEIAIRALQEKKPALLLENVKGSRYPLAINVFASERRIELALGCHPVQIGTELVTFADRLLAPSLSGLVRSSSLLKRVVGARQKTVSGGTAQELIGGMNLEELPVQRCWPKDGGRFITLGQVFTEDPLSRKRNVGIYRLHVYDKTTTGMHWQIQKGGGFHYHRAEQLNQDLEVAVALGTDPALLLAAVAALPEGMDEVMFASFLRGKPIPMTRGRNVSINVPANAEFVLEGVVRGKERRQEGPFGDHFGHYSNAAPFPVFHVRGITHRKNPIYPATVVGIPPMEDKFLGDATQQILGPLARLIHNEVKDIWAYYEAGFHNLLVVSVEERYKKEAMKAALGLLGTGQLSLTKCLILVPPDVNPREWKSVLEAVRDNFDPHFDFVLIPKVPLDTLDFTSAKMELGSKMILDATRKQRPTKDQQDARDVAAKFKSQPVNMRSIDRRITDSQLLEECLLVVKVRNAGREVIEKLVKRRELQGFRMIAAVSEDVDVHDQENCLWGIFTRFDCERDVVFTEQKLFGISPIYRGVLGIDATWKKGYPDPLVMEARVRRKVESRWDSYWK
ncbi:MAG: UbiD family decarboxylase [Bacteroidota bacterium]